jgi:hypothetical protein
MSEEVKPSGKIEIETFEGNDMPKVSVFGDVLPKDVQMLMGAIRLAYFGEYLSAIQAEENAEQKLRLQKQQKKKQAEKTKTKTKEEGDK